MTSWHCEQGFERIYTSFFLLWLKHAKIWINDQITQLNAARKSCQYKKQAQFIDIWSGSEPIHSLQGRSKTKPFRLEMQVNILSRRIYRISIARPEFKWNSDLHKGQHIGKSLGKGIFLNEFNKILSTYFQTNKYAYSFNFGKPYIKMFIDGIATKTYVSPWSKKNSFRTTFST